ncbi:SMP-30/gluconolactonase/LRE family protein [Aeromicrobium sp. 9AM]|uniref:SMP-30/gluconolactonase/LRE family protein n=1 Tax=Aeromicrobium sp. 9AM TaxID=2653126 RepID=UPI0012F02C37|nr:SMP-30/gluconolactonase/LRE family protein [Aeromicrobium sp. 9AM]VXB63063.1 Gluconolactonase protein [Aeromicrobium sp. 9AM]
MSAAVDPRLDVSVGDAEILAAPLMHPEGPDLRADGGLLFVEADSGRICVSYPGRGVATFASTGGSPYGCTLGSDDCVYVTQSGNTDPAVGVPRHVPPSIQRVSPDGADVEILATHADGRAFGAPNDLAWGSDGRLLFTDSGQWDPDDRTDPGFIHALRPDGHAEVVLELGPVFPNGIAVEADGSIIWLESYTRVVGRLRRNGTTEVVAVLPEGHIPEGVKVALDGSLWITNFEAGGVDVIERDGTPREVIHVGGVPVNCLFGDGWLFVADFGHPSDPLDEDSFRPGSIRRIRVTTRGMPLNRGSIDRKA